MGYVLNQMMNLWADEVIDASLQGDGSANDDAGGVMEVYEEALAMP